MIPLVVYYLLSMGPQQANQSGSYVTGGPTVPDETPAGVSSEAAHPSQTIEWEASEAVHHQKDMVWYGGLIAAGLILALLSIFLLRSWTFTILIVVIIGSVIFLNMRPPRVLRYHLSNDGLSIGQKHYSFHEFRAFGVAQDGPFYYIVLLPVKRFMPSIDVYFPEEHGEQIVDMFGAHIPMRAIKPDLVDELTKRLRF